MQDFEKLGAFYLGRQYDLQQARRQDALLLYDAKDLTTHAVCVGMTGSGKTGLCLSLLEEAALDQIPAIAIDPKGDLGNLLLTFPELKPEDFRPWIDSSEASRAGVSLDELARQTAEKWRAGLADWGQGAERIARFRQAVDLAIYTPGSTAGLPLTVLRSFDPPSAAVLNDTEAFSERVATAASGLLSLLGIEADPLLSREHILLANLLDRAWRQGRGLDMAALVRQIQAPPLERVGFVDLETFYPAKERFELAMRLNNLLASPGFAPWLKGEPLDVGRLLYTAAGQPRLSIVSIAHLNDTERMFFVTMLLNEVVAWMRSQSGTTSLRALLYMDEVFGYFPPTANPPSKLPMLTLLKQARAFGLGVVLATQNPVDLDYKGLSNAGTWFLGRLQTERDKARVLDGLEGASISSGTAFDRRRMEQILSGLGNRVFLMHNVHEDQPVVFQTRWALSYLRGPLSRDQIRSLMQARKQAAESPPDSTPTSAAAAMQESRPPEAGPRAPGLGDRPMLPPGVPEFFWPANRDLGQGETLLYRAAVLGKVRLHFARATSGVDVWQDLVLLTSFSGDVASAWEEASEFRAFPELEARPAAPAGYAPLPGELSQPKTYDHLAAALKDYVYRNRRLKLWKSPLLKQVSNPDESEGEFRGRLGHAAREHRDEQVEKLRTKYAPKLKTLEDRILRAEQRVEKEKAQAQQHTMQTAISFGSSLLGALFGRKLASSANVTRAATSMRSASRAARERADIEHAEETLDTLRQRFRDLEAELQEELNEIEELASPETLKLSEVQIKPTKSDFAVEQTVLVWTPWMVDAAGLPQPAFITG